MPDIILVRIIDKPMGVFKRVGANQHPMNLVYLASWLSQQGHLSEIIDLEVEAFEYLEKKLKLAFPYLVGITAMTPNIPDIKPIVKICAGLGVKTVLGGAHPTALPAQTLKDTACDFVVMGEGEMPLSELLGNIKNNISPDSIPGLAFMRNGAAVINKLPALLDIDKLPLPDRRFLKLDKYKGKATPAVPAPAATIFTSRGCPYTCTFCASKIINQQQIRFRSMEKVFAEIDDIIGLGFKHLNVEDDCFTLNQQRVEEFCAYLINKYPNLSWDCDCRVDAVNERILGMMKRSNCKKISFGVESGSPRILKVINKGIDVEQVKHAFRLTKQYGILTQGLFMVGFPEESAQDIQATEKLIDELKPDLLQLANVVPFPGTALYDEMTEKGFLTQADWGSFHFFNDEINWQIRYFSGQDLSRIRRKISRKFYFRLSWLLKRILSVRNLSDLSYLVKGGLVAWKAFGK